MAFSIAGTGTLELVSNRSRSAGRGTVGTFPAIIDLVNLGGTCCTTLSSVVVVALIEVFSILVALVVALVVVVDLVVVALALVVLATDAVAPLVVAAANVAVVRVVIGGVVAIAFLTFLSC